MPGDPWYADKLLLSGAELGSPAREWDGFGASVAADPSQAYSGSFAWRLRRDDALSLQTPPLSGWRGSWRLRHAGVVEEADLASWWRGGSPLGRFSLAGSTWRIYREGGVLAASGAGGPLATSGVYLAISLFVSHLGGSVVCWVNGSTAACYTGPLGSSWIGEIRLGGGSHGWADFAYVDDVVLCDAGGDGSPRMEPPHRLTFWPVTGSGWHAQWEVSDGGSPRHALVATDDGDLSYIQTGVVWRKDSYAAPVAASSAAGVVVLALGRQEGPGAARLGLGLRRSSGEEEVGGPLGLSSSYRRALWWGFGRDPWEGGPWSASGLAGLEVVVQALGP